MAERDTGNPLTTGLRFDAKGLRDALLQQDPVEIRALFEMVLIHFTEFFREPDAQLGYFLGSVGIMIVTVLLSSIWTFNNFDLIWLMTQGGPGDATAPYVMVAYSKAIQQLQVGAGAAVTLGAAGGIHLALVGQHAQESLASGVFFAAAGIAQVLLAVALWRTPGSRWTAVAAGVMAGGLLGLYAVSRLWNVPAFGGREAVDAVDVDPRREIVEEVGTPLMQQWTDRPSFAHHRQVQVRG